MARVHVGAAEVLRKAEVHNRKPKSNR